MTIWGKIIGSATGFAFGGPIGALLGGAAGHALDKIKIKQKLPKELALKQIGFTIGVIVLSAKMAKADGKVTKSEIKAFKEKINVPDNEIKNRFCLDDVFICLMFYMFVSFDVVDVSRVFSICWILCDLLICLMYNM